MIVATSLVLDVNKLLADSFLAINIPVLSCGKMVRSGVDGRALSLLAENPFARLGLSRNERGISSVAFSNKFLSSYRLLGLESCLHLVRTN